MEKTGVEKHIESIVKPIFDKALQETYSNSMTTTKKPISILWRPNNYRRQIEVKTKDNSTIKKIKSAIQEANVNPHTKIVSIKAFMPNITIQYGKNTLTGIYSQNIIAGTKEIFCIEAYTLSDIEERISQKKEDIRQRIDKAIDVFSSKFGLKLPFRQPVWSRYEDFIKGEEYIDKIPREVIIHDTYFKKVYGKGIEFIRAGKEEPTVHLKNFIKNRAVENIAPDIAESINNLGNALINKLNPTIENLAANMNTHISIMKRIDNGISKFNKTVDKLNNRLSQTKLKEYF